LHSPDGGKHSGADAASLLAPLVMHVVRRQIMKIGRPAPKNQNEKQYLTLQRRLEWFKLDDSPAIFAYGTFGLSLCFVSVS